MTKKFVNKLVSSRAFWAAAFVAWVGVAASAQSWADTAGQIGPGTAGTISPTQGVTPAAPDKPHQVLNGALSKETRQTLWEAMNSVTPGPASTSAAGSVVTIGPGEAAEMSGTTIDKIDFESLPATVKGALGDDVQGALSDGSGR